MRIAQIRHDMIVNIAAGDVPGCPIPDHISAANLREWRTPDGGATFVHLADHVGPFYVDDRGIKHILPLADSWQEVRCAFDDRLIWDGAGGWRAESAEERDARESAEAWAPVRAERDRRLAASDWTQLPDAPLDDKARKAWAAYRQALRDMPQDHADPDDVVWPEAPGSQEARSARQGATGSD